MNLFGSFIIAFSMYSKIPMPQVEWTKERMRYAMCFFPLIGVVIGGLLFGFTALAVEVHMGKLYFALVGTALPFLVTGGIHADGFLDTIDARSSYGTRQKKLDILKDPHTGAFAVIGFVIYMMLYAGALSELNLPAVKVFAGAFVLVRGLSGMAVVTFPMAREDGLAAEFSRSAVKKTVRAAMAVYILTACSYMVFYGRMTGVICIAGAFITFLWYYRMSVREFGGITGDLAGYFLQLSELVILMLLCVCTLCRALPGGFL